MRFRSLQLLASLAIAVFSAAAQTTTPGAPTNIAVSGAGSSSGGGTTNNPTFTGVATFGGSGGNAVVFKNSAGDGNDITIVNPTGRTAPGSYQLPSADPPSGGPWCQPWSGSAGVFTASSTWFYCLPTSTISPTALSAQANNYNPTGLATATDILQAVTGNQNISGLAAFSQDERVVTLKNLGMSTGNITLLNHDTTDSSTGNLFCTLGNIVIPPYGQVALKYDLTDTCWTVVGAHLAASFEGGVGDLAAHSVVISELGTPVAVGPGAAGSVFMGQGASADPSFVAGTGTGSPVLATSPTIVTPTLNAPNLSNPSTVTVTAGGTVAANTLVGQQASSGNWLTATAGAAACQPNVATSAATSTNPFTVVTAPGSLVSVYADNTVTAGHVIGCGTSTAGYAKDLGTAFPSTLSSGLNIIGRAVTPASGTGVLFTVSLFGSGMVGGMPASLSTASNCASAASPAVCAAAPTGHVVIAASATSVVVNDSSVSATSDILLTFDTSVGTALSVTCNTTVVQPYVSARTAGTSFTISVASAPATNPACFTFQVTN